MLTRMRTAGGIALLTKAPGTKNAKTFANHTLMENSGINRVWALQPLWVVLCLRSPPGRTIICHVEPSGRAPRVKWKTPSPQWTTAVRLCYPPIRIFATPPIAPTIWRGNTAEPQNCQFFHLPTESTPVASTPSVRNLSQEQVRYA